MLWDEPKIFFLERRYFFSIILSEFLKNRVALQAWLTHLTRILHAFYRDCLSAFSGLSYNKRSMATCIREQLCWILNSQLRDTAKARLMLPDGSYCRKHSAVPFDSQDTFMQQHPHIPAAAAGAPKERVHWLKDLAKKLLWA